MKCTWKILMMGGALLLGGAKAEAGLFEISLGFSFSNNNYTENSYSWTRRWVSSFGYYFSERTSLELGFSDVVNRTLLYGYQDITTHAQIYSINYVQGFFPRKFAFQPYLKGGLGQLIQEASGTYADGSRPNELVLSLTGVLGIGFKLKLTQTTGLRVEAISYLKKFHIQELEDNFSVTFGGSMYF